jgi:hypothetical protein
MMGINTANEKMRNAAFLMIARLTQFGDGISIPLFFTAASYGNSEIDILSPLSLAPGRATVNKDGERLDITPERKEPQCSEETLSPARQMKPSRKNLLRLGKTGPVHQSGLPLLDFGVRGSQSHFCQ